VRLSWIGCAALVFLLSGCVPSKQKEAGNALPPQATAPATPAASAPASSAADEQKRQRERMLLRQVEAAYARGQVNYRRGKLVEARTEFDRAVDLMLESGFDIKSEPQLAAEFDKIVDGVNALEMEALKVGNGFTPQQEPTPADVAEEAAIPADPSILAKAQQDLATTKSDLPLVVNEYVATYINFFANTKKGHNTLLHSFERSGRYKAMIERVMAEEGVPQDLIYLAVAESGFQPRALNPSSHAGGMWQFMPYGNYGLARTAYVDERFDPEKSTRAYARYMKFIYDQLGDWYLAMAGYNWGTGNVQRAVMKTGYSDFWELYKRNNLPAETKNYVPEILAAIIIANHPTKYGFDEITLNAPVLTDTVTVNYSIHLRLVSDLVGTPIGELEALNPSLLRGVTPPDAEFDLHLPPGTTELFNKRVASIPEAKRSSWRFRALKDGDTLASVARDYKVSEAMLADANHLEEGASLRGVSGLAIPSAQAPAPVVRAKRQEQHEAQPEQTQPTSTMYTARRGDTLVTIADRFGVSLAQLRSWNKLRGAKITPGRRLRVSDPDMRSSSARRRRTEAASSDDTRRTTTKKGAKAKSGAASRDAAEKSEPAAKSRSGRGKTSAAQSSREPAPRTSKSRASTRSGSSSKSAATVGAKKSGAGASSARKKTQTLKQK
jgi:membrane-bound lytic murein transglycosylase D